MLKYSKFKINDYLIKSSVVNHTPINNRGVINGSAVNHGSAVNGSARPGRSGQIRSFWVGSERSGPRPIWVGAVRTGADISRYD